MFSFNTNGDVVNCVETKTGAIGYVDATDDTPDTYGVPVEGVDPDTNDLATLVKCGHYRWWGPLAGGRPDDPAPLRPRERDGDRARDGAPRGALEPGRGDRTPTFPSATRRSAAWRSGRT